MSHKITPPLALPRNTLSWDGCTVIQVICACKAVRCKSVRTDKSSKDTDFDDDDKAFDNGSRKDNDAFKGELSGTSNSWINLSTLFRSEKLSEEGNWMG